MHPYLRLHVTDFIQHLGAISVIPTSCHGLKNFNHNILAKSNIYFSRSCFHAGADPNLVYILDVVLPVMHSKLLLAGAFGCQSTVGLRCKTAPLQAEN